MGAEILESLGKAARYAQFLPAALNDELGGTTGRRRGLNDRIGWRLVGVAEHRESSDARSVIDRIIAPHAADYMQAVDTEELVKFATGKIKGALPRPKIAETQHRRSLSAHRCSSLLVTKLKCLRFDALRPAGLRAPSHTPRRAATDAAIRLTDLL